MTDKNLDFDLLAAAVRGSDAAIRIVTRLQPAGGPGDKVFPPTYAGAKYALEDRRLPDGKTVRCVLLDSVQSQANRFEQALLDAHDRGALAFPVLAVDFGPDFPDIGRVTTLDAPHRIADAIFRDSLLDGVRFRDSPTGQAFEAATVRNAAALFASCPTALVFGVWDSTGAQGGLGHKFARCLVSEIVGFDVQTGVRTGSRIDPLGIERCEIFEKVGGGWTADPELAAQESNGKRVAYKRAGSAKDAGKPSALNHGNVTPDIVRAEAREGGEPLGGGVTMSHALQTTVLSLPGLRRLRFPAGDGSPSPARDDAARTLLAALALAGVAWQRERFGYDLRSRCALVAERAPQAEIVRNDGTSVTVGLDFDTLRSAFETATTAAMEEGLVWATKVQTLQPIADLVTLVRRSRELAAVQEA